MGLFDDAFEFLFDDVLGIIDVPEAQTPMKMEQPEIKTLSPQKETQKTLEAIRRQERRTGGLATSLIG
jgi:hypothetical protein